MSELIEVSRVDALLEELTGVVPIERIPLEEANGRILREPIFADRDLPPFHRVMMDGYAIRYRDFLKTNQFTIRGSAFAGMSEQALDEASGSALEVMTGAPLPAGADTIVPFEDTVREASGFRIVEAETPGEGQFIHRKGSDFAKGTTLLTAGRTIRSIETGITASCGVAHVKVSRLPRVAIFGTGDELVPIEEEPKAHQIRRSNAASVASAIEAIGITAELVAHLSDNPDVERKRLEAAIQTADIVIISGAVSKGNRDWIPDTLGEVADCVFHGVRQRPGKPMGVWKSKTGSIIFALPGNPVSTLACAHRYVIPFTAASLGAPEEPVSVRLKEAYSFDRPLTLFLPVKLTAPNEATPRTVNNSGDFAGLADTDGFIELPSTENHWTAGTEARFYSWK